MCNYLISVPVGVLQRFISEAQQEQRPLTPMESFVSQVLTEKEAKENGN